METDTPVRDGRPVSPRQKLGIVLMLAVAAMLVTVDATGPMSPVLLIAASVTVIVLIVGIVTDPR